MRWRWEQDDVSEDYNSGDESEEEEEGEEDFFLDSSRMLFLRNGVRACAGACKSSLPAHAGARTQTCGS